MDEISDDSVEFQGFGDGTEAGASQTIAQDPASAEDDAVNQSNVEDDDAKQQRSDVWQFFNIVVDPSGTKYAHCTIEDCTRKYLLSGKSNGSTGNLRRHLKNRHPGSLIVNDNEAFVFSQEKFRKALLKWIVECNQPFTEPQQEAFIALIQTLNPAADIVTDKTLKADLMIEFAEKKKTLKTELAKVPGKISITMDAWTSKNVLAFLAIRGHWLDQEWNYQSKLLDFAHIEGDHTGFNLSEIFTACLERLEIPFKKILAVTLDNASNNDTFFNWLGRHDISCTENRMRCMAHIINLSVQDIMSELKVSYDPNSHEYDESIDELENELLQDIDLTEEIDDDTDDDETEDLMQEDLIVKLRTVIKKIRKSVQMRQKLKKICETYGLKYLVPVIDVPTRWNSSFHMICRAEQLKVPLQNLCATEKSLSNRQISDREWQELREIKNLLGKFDRATKLMSMERHSTNASYLPTINWLIATLSDYIKNNAGPLAVAARAGLAKLEKYEPEVSSSKLPFICTFMHPALKMEYFKAHNYDRATVRMIQTTIMEYFTKNYEKPAEDSVPAPPTTRKRKRPSNNDHQDDDEDDDFRKHMFKRSKAKNESSEFNKYMNWPITHEDVDQAEFWKANQKDFPGLSAMARDFLPIQSGSVAVERDFSKGVQVVTPTRASLQEKTISAVMFVKSTYHDSKI